MLLAGLYNGRGPSVFTVTNAVDSFPVGEQRSVMMTDTPAFRLLCACCRWPADEAKANAVAEAASGKIDWDAFKALTDIHRVHGLVNMALGPIAIPESLRQWLSTKARAIAAANLLQAHETSRLTEVFERASIPAVVIKGVSLGLHVYGSLAIKQNSDIDLVVQPALIPKAIEVAKAEGYSLFQPAADLSPGQIAAVVHYDKEFGLKNSNGVLLEVHSRLIDNTGMLDERRLDHKGQQISFGFGRPVKTLADDDLFAYLCAHGAHHNWERLKWLADLNALLAHCENGTGISRLNDRAASIGALWPPILAQMLCEEFFARPLPEDLRPLASTKRAQRLKAYCLHAMTLTSQGAGPAPLRKLNDALIETQLGSGRRFWQGFLRHQSVGRSVILEIDLPRRLVFLYPFIRPFFWLWFRWLSPRGRYRWSRKSVDTST